MEFCVPYVYKYILLMSQIKKLSIKPSECLDSEFLILLLLCLDWFLVVYFLLDLDFSHAAFISVPLYFSVRSPFCVPKLNEETISSTSIMCRPN